VCRGWAGDGDDHRTVELKVVGGSPLMSGLRRLAHAPTWPAEHAQLACFARVRGPAALDRNAASRSLWSLLPAASPRVRAEPHRHGCFRRKATRQTSVPRRRFLTPGAVAGASPGDAAGVSLQLRRLLTAASPARMRHGASGLLPKISDTTSAAPATVGTSRWLSSSRAGRRRRVRRVRAARVCVCAAACSECWPSLARV